MKKIIERFQRKKMDENELNFKIIADFRNIVVEECWRKTKIYIDGLSEFEKKHIEYQNVNSKLEKILLAARDKQFVNCPRFNCRYDFILLDILVDHHYAREFCYYGFDHPDSKVPEGLILKFTKKGMLLKRALQSAKTKEQEREDCPQF